MTISKKINRIFKLDENGTTIKTEILAGLTTFITMAYIIALNPNLLTNFTGGGEALWNGVFLATCIASGIGTLAMAFLANKPFAMAPGMGLNTYFAIIVSGIVAATGMSYLTSFQTALVVVLAEGIIFILLSLFNVREKILNGIPLPIRKGLGPAIGLMLLDVALGSNIVAYNDAMPFYALKDFFGAVSGRTAKENIGNEYSFMIISILTMLVGLAVIFLLNHKKKKGAILFGILAASVFYWIMEYAFEGFNAFAGISAADFLPPFKDMAATTLFKFNFAGIPQMGWATFITLVITLCMLDLFDTIGALLGTAYSANMVDQNGRMPKMKEALLADAIGTVAGAFTGTSTVTTYLESSSGVRAGGRTGLTAVTTAILFFLSIFIAPVAAVIPSAATSSALVYVGIMMVSGLKDIDFTDYTQLFPVAMMLLAMPVTGSIGNGLGIGLITYTLIMLCTGKAKKVSLLTYILTGIFIVKFFVAF